MPLPSPTVTANIGALVAAAVGFALKGNVSIYDPTNPVDVPFDPVNDTGGYKVPALLPGTVAYDPATKTGGIKARIVFLNGPHETASQVDWSVNRAVRVQVPLDTTTSLIPKGFLIRVNDGGDTPALYGLYPGSENPPGTNVYPTAPTGLAFTILSAVGGTDAALLTLECVSSLAPTPPIVLS